MEINWGIIGLGKIASNFAHDLLLVEGAVIYGVASRDLEKSRSFAKKFNAKKYFSDYEELIKDPMVDVIYVATPHAFHFPNTMLALSHGKAVLCEKPLGINSREVQTMVDKARSKGLFLMEGLWTRFMPSTAKILELLEADTIGDLEYITANFGFLGDRDPEKRIFNKALGGGSLLDVGIYPIFLSLLILGVPKEIKAMAKFTESEVDSICAVLFDYENGNKAILESSTVSVTPNDAMIYGSKGFIKMHRSFHHTKKITISLYNGTTQTLELDYPGNGFCNEISEVMECLRNNRVESGKMTHSMSLNLIETLDRVRKKIGLTYQSDILPGSVL